jgi:uncharacterized protein (TIGR00645 family)
MSQNRVSTILEKALFASRWLLAPLYVGLAVALILVLWRFGEAFVKLAGSMVSGEDHGFVLELLALLDLVLLANLILIVIFAGYENFVSKIDAAKENEDRPHWMGTIDFSGLKLKLIGSLVAISVIELLKDFIHLGEDPSAKIGDGTIWRIVIHLVFMLSGLTFAVMDYVASKIAPHGEAATP